MHLYTIQSSYGGAGHVLVFSLVFSLSFIFVGADFVQWVWVIIFFYIVFKFIFKNIEILNIIFIFLIILLDCLDMQLYCLEIILILSPLCNSLTYILTFVQLGQCQVIVATLLCLSSSELIKKCSQCSNLKLKHQYWVLDFISFNL